MAQVGATCKAQYIQGVEIVVFENLWFLLLQCHEYVFFS